MPKWWPKRKKDPAVTDTPSLAQTATKDLFTSRGDDYAQNGDYNTAVVMYTEALRHAPADTALLISRSLAHVMSTPPRLDLALQDTDVAIQHNPTSWQAWLQKGETLLREGDVKGAEEALVNAVGFAKGLDQLTAQRSLADARARRSQISPTPAAEPSRTSVRSTVPTQTSAPSLPTTPLSHTPSVTQIFPTQNPTTAISGSSPPLPSSSARQTSPAADPSRTAAQYIPSTQTSRPSLPNTPLSHTPSVTQSSAASNPTTTMSSSTPSTPPSSQPSGKLTPCSYSELICSNGIQSRRSFSE
jgi:hypothetical protein